jgi:hypothetical protein
MIRKQNFIFYVQNSKNKSKSNNIHGIDEAGVEVGKVNAIQEINTNSCTFDFKNLNLQ